MLGEEPGTLALRVPQPPSTHDRMPKEEETSDGQLEGEVKGGGSLEGGGPPMVTPVILLLPRPSQELEVSLGYIQISRPVGAT